MSVSDNNKNRGAHGDSSSMLGWLRPSSENPSALAVGTVKVKANCRINYNGDWHVCGDVFDMDNASASALGDAVTEIKVATVTDNTSNYIEETPRRGRRKKTED